jgi:hypothetical protein
MKNSFLFALVLMAFIVKPTQQVHAQAALFILIFGDKVATEKFHLSLDAGLNFTNLAGLDDGKMRLGVNFGLGTHFKINDRWHLAPEVKFLSRRGVTDVENPIPIPEEFEDVDVKSDIRLNYIDVPILAQYKFENGLYFSAGPQISFLTEARQITKITSNNGNTLEVDQDVKDQFTGIDFSFPVEIAYGIKSIRGGKGVDFRLRYLYGFSEVFESETNLSANHSVFQFFITFPFVEFNDEEVPDN